MNRSHRFLCCLILLAGMQSGLLGQKHSPEKQRDHRIEGSARRTHHAPLGATNKGVLAALVVGAAATAGGCYLALKNYYGIDLFERLKHLFSNATKKGDSTVPAEVDNKEAAGQKDTSRLDQLGAGLLVVGIVSYVALGIFGIF
ncbi:MAG: hypothetical protein M1549_01490 [Candidatus Dependentiae bacterium]|nr:hypothetical protein [Candidatus Dependentiae bacterium]